MELRSLIANMLKTYRTRKGTLEMIEAYRDRLAVVCEQFCKQLNKRGLLQAKFLFGEGDIVIWFDCDNIDL